MKCWICGNDATTGEHRAKKSDLNMIFKNVSQQKPIYTKNKFGKIDKLGSLKADKFKSDAKLCHYCNTTRTQPFDHAWERMSKYLQENATTLGNQKHLKIQRVFPGSVKKSMLDVHLFFVKIFGCLVAEHRVPIDLSSFSIAILDRAAHPCIYLGFGFLNHNKNVVLITPFESVYKKGRIEVLSWQYVIKNVFVDVTYAVNRDYMKVIREYWHPSGRGKLIPRSRLRIPF